MLFSTPFFLFVFLPIFFALYWFLPAPRLVLLSGSIVFYAWSEPIFIFVVFASALLDWLLGRFLVTLPLSHGRRKLLVACGVASNVGLLVYVKYATFAVGNCNTLLAHFSSIQFQVPNIALPLGISFIVFEKITYLVDLYRGVSKPASSLLDYCNYVFLFPKLLAGPIVKYHDIAAQLTAPSHRYEDVRDGLIRFIHGLAKKTIIADTLAHFADRIFVLPSNALDTGSAWLGLLCFTLQIYFDFSGYSDMAIGLARILGFRLLENFNNPYLATSFTDFWRRWHISLSTWIKEYLYIPLGGSRVSTARSYANLCICFVLSGLWHGASWNYVLWGCAHGVALVADRAFWLRWQRMLPRVLNSALTFLLVMLTWVFFRCRTLRAALDFFHALAGANVADQNAVVPTRDLWFVLILAGGLVIAPLVGKMRLPQPDPRRMAQQHPEPAAVPVAANRVPTLLFAGFLLLASITRVTAFGFHPFLYFRF